jgi:hypothetical protein
MFLTLAILMVLLTHLLPVGLAMMVLAVAVLAALALTHRPIPAELEDSDAVPAPTAVPATSPTARTEPADASSPTAPERELVSTHQR